MAGIGHSITPNYGETKSPLVTIHTLLHNKVPAWKYFRSIGRTFIYTRCR